MLCLTDDLRPVLDVQLSVIIVIMIVIMYGAVIVARAAARVHPVHMMNMEWHQAAANP